MPSSSRAIDSDTDLGDSFRTVDRALVVVFGAPLGEFSFEIFENVEDQCPNQPAPRHAAGAGSFLLVSYLVVMAVVLLNLLIAILSTAHKEVHVNGEAEFFLARTRLVLQSAETVAHPNPSGGSRFGMSGLEVDKAVDERLQALGDKYSTLGDEVSDVSKKVSSMEGQEGRTGDTGQQGKSNNHNRRSGGGGDGGSGDSGGNGRGNGGRGGGQSVDGSKGSSKESKRCFRCNWPGHRMRDCTTPVEKFLHRCGVCEGFGHKEDECSTRKEQCTEQAKVAVVEAANFAVVEGVSESSDIDSVKNCAF
eukprot:g8807.t1